MAKKQLSPDALLKNAEKRIKATLPKGEIAYATSDGEVFAKASTPEGRKQHAQNHAFRFKPILQVVKVEGELEEKKK